jgi:hypothetical protein
MDTAVDAEVMGVLELDYLDLVRAAVAAMPIINREAPDGQIAQDLRDAIRRAKETE